MQKGQRVAIGRLFVGGILSLRLYLIVSILALSVTFGDTARVAAPSVCFAIACILLAAAPTAPPCFRHWRRSSPLPPKGEAFLSLFPQKTSEDTFYWTFILLYSCQNKKTQEGRGMKDIELRYVGGHVEVYTEAGAFLFSADTLRETNY